MSNVNRKEIDSTAEPAMQRLRDWFAGRQWTPLAFQQQAWDAYLAGESGLIHAPTGIGKTYAAWGGPLLEALANPALPSQKRGRVSSAPLQVLWITPLRALAADIADALRAPAAELLPAWTVETRTGDTPASRKQLQNRILPTALVTTPESLSLLLSYPGARNRFASLQAVVVDEWHELMGSKRGVLVELALARLRTWVASLRTWGLSATMADLETAMQTLLGRRPAAGRLIRGELPKDVVIEAVIPGEIERFPWAGHLGLKLLPQVVDLIESAGSSLVFTNTRAQCEMWYRAIVDCRPEWSAAVGLHHGSLDRNERETVEMQLRKGMLKCVVCTSSLDLGVDFSPVERVLQIGSPKGVARLLQRAGRSGHRPGAASRIFCVPTHALELIEIAAVRHAIREGRIEPRRPVTLPLDLLVQHLVTVALCDGFEANALFDELKTTAAFADLTRREFDWAVDFVASGGPSLQAYREFARIVPENDRYVVADPNVARRHRLGIGTITSDAAITVKFVKGQRLGTVEERFVARLRKGDSFVFGGRVLEYVRMRDMTLFVRLGRRRKGAVPQWLGGRMPLSTQLAAAVRDRLESVRRGRGAADPELAAVAPLLELQQRWSAIPGRRELLVEALRTRDGRHLFLYPFEGRRVHEGLGALLAWRLSQIEVLSIAVSVNDYGLELLCDREIPLASVEDGSLFRTADLMADILASLNASEMARRQFREVARVAGLVFQGYPGRRKSGSQVQASSGLLYNVFQRYDPENLLLGQSVREVLENQLEFRRLEDCLQRMAQSRVCLEHPPHPTPLAFPLMVDRLRTRVSSEKLSERVQRMQVRLEKRAREEAPQ
jgi:ATP-dependent Lhr-like helicase